MIYDYKIPKVGDRIYVRYMDEFFNITSETCETVKNVQQGNDKYGCPRNIVEFENGVLFYWNNIFLGGYDGVVTKKQHVLENIIPIDCTCPDYISYGYSLEGIDGAVNLYKNAIITNVSDKIRKMKKKIKKLQRYVDKKQEYLNRIN